LTAHSLGALKLQRAPPQPSKHTHVPSLSHLRKKYAKFVIVGEKAERHAREHTKK
jgi:hypothetical protein